MGFIIGLLTVGLVLDCIILVLLVLVQLPKKDAGAGLAFGGAASDALFGAGSGTVLTRITRYAATGFFIVAILLSFLQMHSRGRGTRSFQNRLMNSSAPMLPPSQPAANPAGPAPAPAASNTLLSPTPATTNAPAPAPPTSGNPAAGTNEAAPAAK